MDVNKFIWMMIVVILAGGIAFLVLSFFKGSEYVNVRKYCVQASGALVYPGPGAPASTYLQGSTQFHRSENTISWHWIHNLSSPVMNINVYGPVLPTNPLDGPLFLQLCETGTAAPCLITHANVLQQRISSTIDGLPLADYITDITFHAQEYLIKVATVDFPDGEVVMRLFSLC
jgi:hypothetical protein